MAQASEVVEFVVGSSSAMDQGQSYDAAGRAAHDNRSNQLNPNNPAYGSSRSGVPFPPRGNDNNRANQMNPNNPAYSKSRGSSSGGEGGAGSCVRS
mmetsp:Transcript_40949/g.89213  ORF Transcript_40949/g.89213 Transcript_40949/m.89213 type:complete len:96 (-) Transcript_40949:220-507(-)